MTLATPQAVQSVPLGAGRPETPGVERTPLRDDAQSSVVRVNFAAGAKEPPHTHGHDVLLIPLGNFDVEFNIGGTIVTRLRAGEVQFVPRDVTHSLVNTGRAGMSFITVALK